MCATLDKCCSPRTIIFSPPPSQIYSSFHLFPRAISGKNPPEKNLLVDKNLTVHKIHKEEDVHVVK